MLRILLTLGASFALSLLASPAYSASNTDVQWVARWLDDGGGNAAMQAVVQAATPKRFFAAGDACTLLDENNTAGTFGPYAQGNECVLGEGPGRGQDADWDHLIRINIQSASNICPINAKLKFKVGAFELDVDWEYCEFRSAGGGLNDALVYSFPVPQRSAFAEGVEAVEVFIPNVTSSRIGWWRFPPPPPPAQCSEVTDWQAAADTVEWTCTHDGTTYEYADFHVLKRSDSLSGDCSQDSFLPINGDRYGEAAFCRHDGNYTYAIFDWHGPTTSLAIKTTTHIDQIGSRSANANDCSTSDQCTVAGRVPNQLKNGDKAFCSGTCAYGGQGGQGFPNLVGGAGIENLDTSNLTNLTGMFSYTNKFNADISNWKTGSVTSMWQLFLKASEFTGDISNWDTGEVLRMEAMFQNATKFNGAIGRWNTSKVSNMKNMFNGAKAFNQDLSGWPVGSVTSRADFDKSTDGWCGTGMTNRGRPADWVPYAESSSCPPEVENFVVLTAPETVIAGDQLTYELVYWNSSDAATTGNTLVLKLPAGVTVPTGADLSGGVASGDPVTVTWSNIDVPGDTTQEGGAEIKIPVNVNAGLADQAVLSAEAKITDSGNITISDTANVTVTSKAALSVEITSPTYALPGDDIVYHFVVRNEGKSDTQSGVFTISWDSAESVVPATVDSQNCTGTPLLCTWNGATLRAGQTWEDTITATIPADAELGTRVVAEATATASNAGASDESGASAVTEVRGAPEIKVRLGSLPLYMVKPSGTVEYTMVLANSGTAMAKEVSVALPLPSGTSAPIPTGAFCDDLGSTVTCPGGSYLSWSLGTVGAGAAADALSVTVNAPASAGGLTLQAQFAAKTEQDESFQGVSNPVTLQVADKPRLDLGMSFTPTRYKADDDLTLKFDYENVGTADATTGQLVFDVPDGTQLASWETGAQCGGSACSVGYTGAVTFGVGTVKAAGETGDTGEASFGLSVLSSVGETIESEATLKPTTAAEFLPQSARARAEKIRTEQTVEPHVIVIEPAPGSSCSIDWAMRETATNYPGWTLAIDDLLQFEISGCEAGETVPVRITLGEPVPEEAVPVKTSGDTLAAIPGGTLNGQVIRYNLVDNEALDLNPAPGTLRDPVGAAIVGGSGIYIPLIPVPIPYWVLGLLASLMGWLGYRRLRLA